MGHLDIKKWILGVLAGAQQDRATELIISHASEGSSVAIRYKTDGAWHDWAPEPQLMWSRIVSELAGLAGIREAPFPKEGIIYLAYSGVRLRWQLKITSPDAECVLYNLWSAMV